MRTESTVQLRGLPDGTSVAVDASLVLAGALGSVGQKVIAKQASKVTAEFAANLRRALGGETPTARGAGPRAGMIISNGPAGEMASGAPFPPRPATPDRWSRAAAVLSAASAVLSVIVLVRQGRRAR
jgi:hypothetical protein